MRLLPESLVYDVRYAARALVRRPGFTAVAALTLALGIGPMATVFALAHAVLFRPLPYPEPERLVRVWKNASDGLSAPDVLDLRERSRTCERISTFTIYGVFDLVGDGEPEAVQGSYVSADLFAALGVAPSLGRAFLEGEDRPGSARLVVLGDGLWKRRFGGDPSVVGRTLSFDDGPRTVVGVMPPGFEFPIAPAGTQLWANAALDPAAPRDGDGLNVVARLRAGASPDAAAAELGAALRASGPDRTGARVASLRAQLTGDARRPLFVLLGAIAFVLLVACANVANLMLARSADRAKEIALRASLGASRSRLFRQTLAESLLLAVLGGALGLLLAVYGVDLLVAFGPASVPRLAEAGVDGRVLGFVALVVLATGVVFGTLSTLRLSEGDVREALAGAGSRATAGLARQRFRRALVVSEIALSLVLLVGAGLMLRSFLHLRAVDPGFRPEGVLCLNVSLPESRYRDPARRAAFVRQAVERLAALPPARAVAAASFVPWTMGTSSRRFAVDGEAVPPEPDRAPSAGYLTVTPDYFRTLGVGVVDGRGFVPQDDGPGPGVAVVNETFARRAFPDGGSAVGRRIRVEGEDGREPQSLEVVGVVGDVKQGSLDGATGPEIYVPQGRDPQSALTFFVRADGDTSSVTAAAEGAIREADPDLPVAWATTLESALSASIADRRGLIFLLGAFAALALVLAAVGVYGVVSHSVARRTYEIGVRMALGARREDAVRLVLRQGLGLALVGVGVGLAASLPLARVLASLLFEVSATDSVTLVVAPPVLIGATLLACIVPALRATRVDPIRALRHD